MIGGEARGHGVQYRKRYGPVATNPRHIRRINVGGLAFQYCKRYGPVATYGIGNGDSVNPRFQYRKRYGPVATIFFFRKSIGRHNGFQYRKRYYPVATRYYQSHMHYIPDDRFQYRKRYYPVATALRQMYMAKDQCFNTASGMAQLQRKVVSLVAVITDGFNTASGITQLQLLCKETEINGELFQYRKRYVRVATLVQKGITLLVKTTSFNTASGMAQLQPYTTMYTKNLGEICFNTASGMAQLQHGSKLQ